jgi:protein TonB
LIEPLLQKPAPQTPEIRPEPTPKSVLPTPVTVPTPRQDIKQEVTPPTETSRSIPAPPQTMAGVAPVAQVVTEPPKPVMQQAAPALNIENNYISSVRNTLNANKRYPTGREASLQRPSGKVKIGFVLLRNGSLVELDYFGQRSLDNRQAYHLFALARRILAIAISAQVHSFPRFHAPQLIFIWSFL